MVELRCTLPSGPLIVPLSLLDICDSILGARDLRGVAERHNSALGEGTTPLRMPCHLAVSCGSRCPPHLV